MSDFSGPMEMVPERPYLAQSTRYGRCLKFLFDYTLVIPATILLAPLLLLLAILVKMDSPGPVLYRRRVLGRDGRPFDAFRFRTMYVNGHEILNQYPKLRAQLHQNYNTKCDPRLTFVGRLLRKYNLDELPQLFNVLARQMSLVGPRIITPAELVHYGQWSKLRLCVMPGLTGLWQVNGRSNTIDEERIALDMAYIFNWSLGADVKILLQTVPAVIKIGQTSR